MRRLWTAKLCNLSVLVRGPLQPLLFASQAAASKLFTRFNSDEDKIGPRHVVIHIGHAKADAVAIIEDGNGIGATKGLCRNKLCNLAGHSGMRCKADGVPAYVQKNCATYSCTGPKI